MKKSSIGLNVWLVLVSILILTGCANESQRQLAERVEETAASCPIEIASGVSIDNVSYSDDIVRYSVSLKSPLFDLSLLNGKEDLVRTLLVEAVKLANDSTVNHEIRLCQEAGAGIEFQLSDSKGQQMTIKVNPTDYIGN